MKYHFIFKNILKPTLITIFIVACFIFAGYQFEIFSSQRHGKVFTKAILGGEIIHITVADTQAKREQGLSGTKSLAKDSGMLFLFPRKDLYRFWMPDMNYPIDIIWVDSHRIVDIRQNVSNIFDPKHPIYYTPTDSADAVLEVNAGFVESHSIRVGDKAIYQ